MHYKRLNNITGWAVFLIATVVYFLTLESTASLWDCGEYITAANKLEVGHPPGAPFFMILGRLFSFFAEPEMVAVWINRLSALCSSFTILFMFWSITMLGKKIMQRVSDWSRGDQLAVVAAGVIGSLAYTFSDSFWFSAVEGEVYAMSSLFTAAIFWMILKWDVEMNMKKAGELTEGVSPMRWLILIMFLFGLAIGVHLLGLLIIPAIAFVMYFNMWEKTTPRGIIVTGIISVVALGFIQEGIIPGIIYIASGFEVFFVNSLGMPFFAGTIFFFVLVVVLIIYGMRYAKRKGKAILNISLWSLTMLLIGYGTFAVIVIRSNANTPLDENDPENLVTLHAYLKREQYGSWPILSGPYWNSFKEGEELVNGQPRMTDNSSWGDRSPFYLRRFVVQLAGEDMKAFKLKAHADAYAKAKGGGYEVVEKYFSANEKVRKNQIPKYRQSTFLPRMYYEATESGDAKIGKYKYWSGYTDEADPDPERNGTDGLRLPTFGENLQYMGSYQINWMYWRYFMWNFAGRQNDIQGHGDQIRGNYQTGFAFLDEPRLGSQEFTPSFTQDNPANNKFFLLPLVLGILGLIYHIYRDRKGAFVVFLTFLFTGMAIVIYLNQKPLEPRERDYAYAASFYAFAMWIGFGVLAIYEAYKNFKKEDWNGIMKVTAGLTGLVLLFTIMGGKEIMLTYLFTLVLGGLFLLLGLILRRVKVSPVIASTVIFLVTLFVPYLMGSEGWDDHNRNGKTSARDLANNYLMSCAPNGILFTVGDNDTFPLWYLQEVEGKYTDIRVCNTSLFGTDWYTEQMMMKAYGSEPLPISFREDQILQYEGLTDQVLFATTKDCIDGGMSIDLINKYNTMKIKINRAAFNKEYTALSTQVVTALKGIKTEDASIQSAADAKIKALSIGADSATAQSVLDMNEAIDLMVNGYQNGVAQVNSELLSGIFSAQMTWETKWAYLPIDVAMEFAHNDEYILNTQYGPSRAVPCTGFHIPVNKDNAVKSGIITAKEKSQCVDSVLLVMDSRGAVKSDLMILDMLANNHWKRAMYFSSPGGTEIGMSLYHSGFLRQNGMAWEVSPIKSNPQAPFNVEAMYNNLMNRYEYGAMNQKGVLTDYYARRQTGTMRGMFSQLAEYYLQRAEEQEFNMTQYGPVVKNLRAAGRNAQADSLETTLNLKNSEELISSYKKKAVKVIQRSLEVMPIDLVIDYGEMPNPGRRIMGEDKVEYAVYQDGSIHEYVGILFRAGAKKEAEKLGMAVTDQLESTLRYFYNSDAGIAGDNYEVLSATMTALISMDNVAHDPGVGSPNGKLSQRLGKLIAEAYEKEFPKIYQALEQKASENGESRGSGRYYGSLMNLRGNLEAIGVYFKVLAPSIPQGPTNSQPPAGKEAIIQDSDLNREPKMDSQNVVMGGM